MGVATEDGDQSAAKMDGKMRDKKHHLRSVLVGVWAWRVGMQGGGEEGWQRESGGRRGGGRGVYVGAHVYQYTHIRKYTYTVSFARSLTLIQPVSQSVSH